MNVYDNYSNSGYDGYSMSIRAREAYEDGEMPKSKWTKKAMLETIKDYCEDEEITYLKEIEKLTKAEIFDHFFYRSSWHHTSKFYNETEFYRLDEESLKEFSKEDVERIISERKPKKRISEKEKRERKEEKQLTGEAKEIQRKLEIIFDSGITGLKRYNSLVNRYVEKRIDLEEEYSKAKEAILKRNKQKIRAWEHLTDDYHREMVELYKNEPSLYIEEVTHGYGTRNTLKTIKKYLKQEAQEPELPEQKEAEPFTPDDIAYGRRNRKVEIPLYEHNVTFDGNGNCYFFYGTSRDFNFNAKRGTAWCVCFSQDHIEGYKRIDKLCQGERIKEWQNENYYVAAFDPSEKFEEVYIDEGSKVYELEVCTVTVEMLKSFSTYVNETRWETINKELKEEEQMIDRYNMELRQDNDDLEL